MSLAPSWPGNSSGPLPSVPSRPVRSGPGPARQLRLVHSTPAVAEPRPAEPTEPTDTELFVGLTSGEPRAVACREQLARRYSWLATSCARRYSGRGENDDDLQQIACVGLLEAMSRFDPSRGVAFEFFARPTILGHLRRHFRDGRRWVRVPRRLQELGAEVKEARDDLAVRYCRTPTLAELAEHLGVQESEIAEALAADQFFAPTSLDAPLSGHEPDGLTRADLVGGPDSRLDLVDGWTALRPLLDDLPPREREILVAVFWKEETQAVVGARLGISQMQVSRVLSRILRELRGQLDAG